MAALFPLQMFVNSLVFFHAKVLPVQDRFGGPSQMSSDDMVTELKH